jgi:DNA-binding NarL/FixJ family response regulator
MTVESRFKSTCVLQPRLCERSGVPSLPCLPPMNRPPTQNGAAITLFLADEHTVVRQGLCKLIEDEPDLSVVGQAATGLDVADHVERIKPAVLVLEVRLPGLNGFEVTRQVTKRTPSTRVLILSGNADEQAVVGALRSGASGYLLKSCDAAELIRVIRRVASGAHYVSTDVSSQVVRAILNAPAAELSDPYEQLTDRQRQVLQLIAEGNSNSAIATKLFISRRTVETHRANAVRLLGLRTQTDIVRYALQRGILRFDS